MYVVWVKWHLKLTYSDFFFFFSLSAADTKTTPILTAPHFWINISVIPTLAASKTSRHVQKKKQERRYETSLSTTPRMNAASNVLLLCVNFNVVISPAEYWRLLSEILGPDRGERFDHCSCGSCDSCFGGKMFKGLILGNFGQSWSPKTFTFFYL